MIAALKVCFRTISCTMYSTQNQMYRDAKMLNKMLQKSASNKKSKGNFKGLISKGNLLSAFETEVSSKRMIVANKIYMQNIVPMLTCGTYGSELTKLEVEVTKVQVNKTFEYLDIYWITRKVDIPENTIEPILQKALKELQLQVGNIKHISKVPYVRFVRDERLEKAVHLEKLFEIADYGEDYEPIYGRKVLTPSNQPSTGNLPEMRPNVLSVDREQIKAKIMAKIFRNKAINLEEKSSTPPQAPQKLIPFSAKDFYKFYNRRRILALKLLKRGFYDD